MIAIQTWPVDRRWEVAVPENQPLGRDEVMDHLTTIWRLSGIVQESGFRDIDSRATEIHEIAHFLLYDDDGGIDEDR
jgi:hypothetical protein